MLTMAFQQPAIPGIEMAVGLVVGSWTRVQHVGVVVCLDHTHARIPVSLLLVHQILDPQGPQGLQGLQGRQVHHTLVLKGQDVES